MKHADLEYKVLGIIDQVKAKQFTEGSAVELKAEWIDPIKAARRLAGHANAARGDPILWIIGLDEVRGVMGAKKEDLAEWWAQVQKQFDREPPDLVMSMSVSHGDATVMALYFETSRAPFVVKNPLHNSEKGPIEYEVPWRDGTRTRTARHEDLVRILVPVARVPEIEVREARVEFGKTSSGFWNAKYAIGIFAVVRSPIVIAAHRCELALELTHVCPIKPWHEQSIVGPPNNNAGPDVHLVRSSAITYIERGDIRGIGPIFGSTLRGHVSLGIIDVDTRPVARFELILDQLRSHDQYVEYELNRS